MKNQEEPREQACKNVLSRQAGSFASLKPASRNEVSAKKMDLRGRIPLRQFSTVDPPLARWPLARRKCGSSPWNREEESRKRDIPEISRSSPRNLYTTRNTTANLNKHIATKIRRCATFLKVNKRSGLVILCFERFCTVCVKLCDSRYRVWCYLYCLTYYHAVSLDPKSFGRNTVVQLIVDKFNYRREIRKRVWKNIALLL